jgi:hypothetical protein
MIEDEAHSLAELIRSTSQQHISVEEITRNANNDLYEIRCRYIGPTTKTELHLFLHGMDVWIKTSYQWTLLKKCLKLNM